MTDPSDSPFAPRTGEDAHLRQTRFWTADDDMIERWVWEPLKHRWELRQRKTLVDWDIGAKQWLNEQQEPLTDAELQHAERLADRMGWK